MSEYSLDKLPKWARNRIANLEREVETLTEAVRGQLINPAAPWSNVWLPAPRADRSDMDEAVKTGFRSAWFSLDEPKGRRPIGDRSSIEARVVVPENRGKPHLKLMGGGGLVIAPDVTNVVRIYLDDEWR
jgi:hypothetical protein